MKTVLGFWVGTKVACHCGTVTGHVAIVRLQITAETLNYIITRCISAELRGIE